MKRRIILLTVFFSFAVFFSGAALAAYSGGDGTEEAPFQLSTAANWTELVTTTADWDKHFILTADLDFSGIEVVPIGDSSSPFTGVVDGGGHAMKNIVMTDMSASLFYSLSNAKIQDLRIENILVDAENAGAALSLFASASTFGNCSVSGKISARSADGTAAGLVLHPDKCTFTQCTSTADVSAFRAGGLAGYCLECIFTDCAASGKVTASGDNAHAGGFLDFCGANTQLMNCSSTAEVTVTGKKCFVGGLISDCSSSTVGSCYFKGRVNGDGESLKAGGLAGNSTVSAFINCSSKAEISTSGDKSGVGGLIGLAYPAVVFQLCTSFSKITSTGDELWIGGFAGLSANTYFQTCYFSGEVHIPAGSNIMVGGLVGYGMNSALINSYSKGIVDEAQQNGVAGGLAGVLYSSDSASVVKCAAVTDVRGYTAGGLVGVTVQCNYANCYALGTVSGKSCAGGLIGSIYPTYKPTEVSNCYAAALVEVTEEDGLAGGLIGESEDSQVTSSYWDTEVSGVSVSAGGEGRTTADMTWPYAEDCYVDWDFEETWGTGPETGKQGYPQLLSSPSGLHETEGENEGEGEGENGQPEGEEGETGSHEEGELSSEGELSGEGESAGEGEVILPDEGESPGEGEHPVTPDKQEGCGCSSKDFQTATKDLLADWLLISLCLGALLSGSAFRRKF